MISLKTKTISAVGVKVKVDDICVSVRHLTLGLGRKHTVLTENVRSTAQNLRSLAKNIRSLARNKRFIAEIIRSPIFRKISI